MAATASSFFRSVASVSSMMRSNGAVMSAGATAPWASVDRLREGRLVRKRAMMTAVTPRNSQGLPRSLGPRESFFSSSTGSAAGCPGWISALLKSLILSKKEVGMGPQPSLASAFW